jgi:hypothetical protein
MTQPTLDLEKVERWMQTVIMHPGGVTQGLASEDARRYAEKTDDNIEAIVTRSTALTAIERLAIYSRAYQARLLECLRAEFPALSHALGADLFNRFACDYLQRHPSQSYTLGRLGEKFPRYLAETRPDAHLSPSSRESWPDFIIDLATLEREFSEVFDGPGVEGQQVVVENELSELLESERWADAMLVTVPCLRLLSFRYPVNTYFLAARKNEEAEFPEPALTLLALTRCDYRVFLHELSQDQYEVLKALTAREPLAQAIKRAATPTGADSDAPAVKLRAWLDGWAVSGFFSAIVMPS